MQHHRYIISKDLEGQVSGTSKVMFSSLSLPRGCCPTVASVNSSFNGPMGEGVSVSILEVCLEFGVEFGTNEAQNSFPTTFFVSANVLVSQNGEILKEGHGFNEELDTNTHPFQASKLLSHGKIQQNLHRFHVQI